MSSHTNEMIERVARALYAAATVIMDDDAPDDWDDIGPDHDKARVEWSRMARAAIEAMKSPTAEMVDALDLAITNNIQDLLVAEVAFHAAIDAALQEKQG